MIDVHPDWLESDDEFEGVGAHRDNPRFDMDTALADSADLIPFPPKEPDAPA